MATRCITRSLLTTKSIISTVSRSYTTASSSSAVLRTSLPFHIRPLFTAASASYCRRLALMFSTRGFATHHMSSSLNDSNPNWSNLPPKETILLDGCDFEHWLVVVEKPKGEPTRDEIIDSYIAQLLLVEGGSRGDKDMVVGGT